MTVNDFYAPAIGASTSSFSTLLANSCHPLRNLNIPCGGFNIPCESFNIPCEGYNIPCEIPVIIPCGNSAVRAKCQKILESSAYTSYACSVFILHYRLFQLISPINSLKNWNITIILVYNFRLIYYPVLFSWYVWSCKLGDKTNFLHAEDTSWPICYKNFLNSYNVKRHLKSAHAPNRV